ncbi:HAD family phosphatase [Pseudomonas lurida]|jgi:beta-phosphoglucomutase-like phosphatase (HAD superfamily)|uniref:HAD family phosphatase n=1 Tax=Pseudomonas TaxID=286 RepID=UPI0015E47985|nr:MULTISPECIES: HAD family phosphatase [Pseudomonas]MBA1293383.1 HAD family phosphatase [Pseudomonas lurida]MCP1515224.1 beta-phosphoglucomutase-like phosphatase (HAD superfamily) [Pseudomonas rhodesiae]MDF9768960.1 beta-phosphoglucomutase-like phosphatase (HAD superfamily) [Pseudomonas rhodesiae]WLH42506.1 HAD family phosphatase [Pseudomonas sp. FP2254]
MPHAEIAIATAPTLTAVLFGLSGCLVDFGSQARTDSSAPDSQATPGALNILRHLKEQGVPCAWLDELPPTVTTALAAVLPRWVKAISPSPIRWPAPHACWQALMELNIERLEGCVLVSGEPRLLQSGLNAGLWTIGLASCGSLCGLAPEPWQALSEKEREHKRAKATVALYGLGVHSVIDHLGELGTCLADISLRRLKGEKP